MDKKDKLEESSLINNTKKYSNLVLPTVGGIIGFMCAGPILGGSLGSIALLSLFKTTTTIAGSIGASKATATRHLHEKRDHGWAR